MKGFLVPNSISSSYVANKRNDEGSFLYDSAANQVGLEKQAALQTLNKNYAQTIDNAYASYLSANKGVMGSNMGQGYKEAYTQRQQEGLAQQVAQSNMNASQVRYDLNLQEDKAREQLDGQFKTEVANFDRTAQTMNDYLSYVKTLTGTDGISTYLSAEQSQLGVDTLYDTLFNAQPQGYTDAEGNLGKSYVQFVNDNLKNNAGDTAWSQWLFGMGGYQEFKNSVLPQQERQFTVSTPAEQDKAIKDMTGMSKDDLNKKYKDTKNAITSDIKALDDTKFFAKYKMDKTKAKSQFDIADEPEKLNYWQTLKKIISLW